MQLKLLPIVQNPIFLLDYDGTLAPIQQEPMQAFPHVDAVPLLTRLRELHPLWIVTGRHLNDLNVLLNVQLNAIGLHGLQKGRIGAAVHVTMPESTQNDITSMKRLVPDIDEVRIEEKEYTFAVHYRGALNEEPIIEALNNWLNDVPDSLDVIWGKKVVELKPKGISKGSAIQELLQQYNDHAPIYIGDDTTDEAAFETLHHHGGIDAVTIKVGPGPTCAKYRLPDVDAVIEYLKQYNAG